MFDDKPVLLFTLEKTQQLCLITAVTQERQTEAKLCYTHSPSNTAECYLVVTEIFV